MTEDRKPWWWHQPTDAAYIQHCRDDYDQAKGMSDEEIVDFYADGNRYWTGWDHTGEAHSQFQELADAFLKLVEETGKQPSDFK